MSEDKDFEAFWESIKDRFYAADTVRNLRGLANVGLHDASIIAARRELAETIFLNSDRTSQNKASRNLFVKYLKLVPDDFSTVESDVQAQRDGDANFIRREYEAFFHGRKEMTQNNEANPSTKINVEQYRAGDIGGGDLYNHILEHGGFTARTEMVMGSFNRESLDNENLSIVRSMACEKMLECKNEGKEYRSQMYKILNGHYEDVGLTRTVAANYANEDIKSIEEGYANRKMGSLGKVAPESAESSIQI